MFDAIQRLYHEDSINFTFAMECFLTRYAGWTTGEWWIYRWHITDYFDGGDIIAIPEERVQEFEQLAAENDREKEEISRRIKEYYAK